MSDMMSARRGRPQMADADSDEALLAAVREADRSALAALYDRYVPTLLAVACRMLQNRRDAEDLIHDLFLEVWHKAGHYDARRGTVRHWLFMRLRSRAIDRIRALSNARKHAMMISDEAVTGDDREVDITRHADYQHASRAMQQLSEEQRHVLELAYFKGWTCRDIATGCGIPIGTVKSRLAAAVALLRRELSEQEEQL